MEFCDALNCLKQIRVCLDWKRMAKEQWPISIEKITTPDDLCALYMPKYRAPDGTLVEWNHPFANPLTVRSAVSTVAKWEDGGAAVTQYLAIFQSSPIPIEVTFSAYQLQTGRLLLDGNHRAVALAIAGVPFEVNLLLIHGPQDESALPDLRVHMHKISK